MNPQMLEDDSRAALEQLLTELIEKPVRDAHARQVTPQLNRIATSLSGLSTALGAADESVLEVCTGIRDLAREVFGEASANGRTLAQLQHAIESSGTRQDAATETTGRILAGLETGLETLAGQLRTAAAATAGATGELQVMLASIQQEHSAAMSISRQTLDAVQLLKLDSERQAAAVGAQLAALTELQGRGMASLRQHQWRCTVLASGGTVIACALVAVVMRYWP
jgi:hypothetical protein